MAPPSPTDAYAFLDHFHSRGIRPSVDEILTPVAALVLLQWLDAQDREAEAVAAFDGRPHTPALPDRLRWERLRTVGEEELAHAVIHLDEAIVPEGGSTVGDLGRRMARAVRSSSSFRMDPMDLAFAFDWVDRHVDFDAPESLASSADAFGWLLKQLAKGSRNDGYFLTPDPIADFVVELADPRPGERVYDPCLGTGGLLELAARRLTRASRYSVSEAPAVYGGELVAAAYLVGAARVVLAGAVPHLEWGDSLDREFSRNGLADGFDCVIANPPFGGRVDPSRYPHLAVPSRDASELFVQHAVAALRPGGRAVVVVPEGFRWKGGATRALRQRLLETVRLEGVVSLPEGAFVPYASIKTSALVLRREEPRREVWFYGDAELDAALVGRAADSPEAHDTRRTHAGLARAAFEVEQDADEGTRQGAEAFAIPVAVSTLEARDYELETRRPGETELADFVERARRQTKGLQVSPLKSLAHVQRGTTYRREDTTEEESTVALIRVGDIQDGEVLRAELGYDGDELPSERYRTEAGDVLVSVSGTIGKTAAVPESLSGGVATNGLAVVRVLAEHRDSVRADYLAALLGSAVYRDWMEGHSRGGYIRHLSPKQLRKLPIPVPTLEQQERLVQLASEGADVAEAVLTLGDDTAPDPLKSWLLSVPATTAKGAAVGGAASAGALSAFSGTAAGSSVLAWLGGGAIAAGGGGMAAGAAAALVGGPLIGGAIAAYGSWRALRKLREDSPNKELGAWAERLAVVGQQLEEALELDAGAERYALLQGLGQPVAELRASVPSGEAAVQERAESLTQQLVDRVEAEREALLGDIHLTGRVEPALVELGTDQTVTVTVRNESPLRLRQLELRHERADARSEVATLASGDETAWEVRIPTDTAGDHALVLGWSAKRLDRAGTSGEIELAYHVRGIRDAVTADLDDIGDNPYVEGVMLSPSTHPHLFKGREDRLGELLDALEGQGGSATIIVEGPRRIGKSSLVKQIVEGGVLSDGWTSVYCDFQGTLSDESAGLETPLVFYTVADAVVQGVAAAGHRFEVPGVGKVGGGPLGPFSKVKVGNALLEAFTQSKDPAKLLNAYIEEALATVAPSRLLLVLDEFDKVQQGIETGVTSPQVPSFFRSLFQRHPSLAGLLVCAVRLRRLREEYFHALYGLGAVVEVGPLDREAAVRLVREPVAGRLIWAPAAIDRVLDLTARQPFLVQGLCRRVFNACRQSGIRTATVALVDDMAAEHVRRSGHFAQVFKTDTGSHRKRYLIALTEAEAGRSALTYEVYEQRLREGGVRTDGLDSDLEDLVGEEVLDREKRRGEDRYRLRVPLLAMWVRQQDYSILHNRAADESAP